MSEDPKTIPAPPDDELLPLLRNLRASLERTSELCVKVAGRLSQVEIAVLTAEHRLNVQRDRLDGFEQKVADLVLLLPSPPAAPPDEAA
jgi:hypothetical protein